MSDVVPAEFAAWSVAWAEEFDGPAGSPADPRTWRPETGGHGWGNSELQYYTSEPANAALDGSGNLAITVARPGSRLARTRYEGCQYTSARLITKNLRAFRYGLIQARIRLPPGRGIWPAFWMLGTSIDTAGWPGCGEIDVMENFGTSASMVHGTVHGPGYSGERGITASLDTGAPLAAGFHAYSVCWEPGRIRWYADQTLYHTVTPADLHGRPWVFDHDFYLLINVAVGGRPSQDPDRSTAFPQAMLIDYIRVYTASLGAHALAFRVIPAGYLRRPGPSGVAGALRERRSLSGVAGAIPGAPAPCARLRPAPPGPFSALQSRLH